MSDRIRWPNGADFAFTVFDDTDRSAVDNVGPVYAFLADIGMYTTKSVWPLRGSGTPRVGGATCEDKAYLDWVLKLQEQGFEIGLHNVTYHTSPRQDTIRGIQRFHELFGHAPYSMANHVGCDEGIYWGDRRLTGIHQKIYNFLTRNRWKGVFEGHIERSPLFWGDICRQQIKYVRSFVYGDINPLRACPYLPYYDPRRPHVAHWFASSEGPRASYFVETISEKNQDRLAAEGGACIMYTHLACGFWEDGRLHPRFKALMERLRRMNGWFVPVRTLLDYLLDLKGVHELTDRERRCLERRWLWHKVKTRGRG